MLFIILSYLLLLLLNLCPFAQTCHPSVWAVGLSAEQTLENHLRIVGRSIDIQEHRLDSNIYTASIPNDDKAILSAIRSESSVGFLVKIPQNYFRTFDQFLDAGWDEDDDECYEHKLFPIYQWSQLQPRDPEIIASFLGRRVPLQWDVKLEEGYALDVHINYITQLNPTSVSTSQHKYVRKMHTVTFRSEEQERKYLPLMYNDPRVEDVWPNRCFQPEITYFNMVNGKLVPGWKDPCIWKLGYRQWDKYPVFSIESEPGLIWNGTVKQPSWDTSYAAWQRERFWFVWKREKEALARQSDMEEEER
ncbi:hypothetical protein KCU73_g7850, partial [Aureobasidium melanogenum]